MFKQQPVSIFASVVQFVSRMVRRTVTLGYMILYCACAAPVPDSAKISLIRNSTFGLAIAAGGSKTAGILEGNRHLDIQIVRKVVESRPDFTLVENVNSGAGIAIDRSISVGVIKNNILAGKNPFWRKK